MQSRMTKRLQKDLEQMQKNYADVYIVRLPTNDIKLWIVAFEAAKGTVYEGEKYELQFRFSNDYVYPKCFYLAPFFNNDSPSSPLKQSNLIYLKVIFIGKPPDHEHIYSNGFICLSILFDEWSAALTVSSVCLSIQSMLSSATKKMKPANDAEFVKRAAGRGPKSFLWSYHDEKC